VAANDNLRVDALVMQRFAQGLLGAAESLRSRLTALDEQVGDMLGGWRGASGSAYGSAWEMWHRGATEVELGLSMLARLVGEAGGGYQQNEAGAAQAFREVRGG
jgi:WXG100 family type VII secretion target